MFYKEKYTGRVSRSKANKEWEKLIRFCRFHKVRYRRSAPTKRLYNLGIFQRTSEPLNIFSNGDPMYYVPKENNEPLPTNPRFELMYVPKTPSSYDARRYDRYVSDEYSQFPSF